MINFFIAAACMLFVLCFVARSFPGLLIMFAVIVVLIGLGGCVEFDHKWTKENSRLETTYQLLHAADVVQTLQLHNHPELREANPLLGDHPTQGKIGAFYLISAYGHAYTTDALDAHVPRWACRTWQALTLVDAAEAVRHNYQLGLRFGF